MEVLSPTFGTLGLLHVDDGSLVAEGEMLGEVEVMKTFHRIIAPVAGTLTWLVGLGEVVGEGDVLAEIAE